MTIIVKDSVKFEGVHYVRGTYSLDNSLEQRMVNDGKASYLTQKDQPLMAFTDAQVDAGAIRPAGVGSENEIILSDGKVSYPDNRQIRGLSSGQWSLVENILGAAEVSRTFRSHDIRYKIPVKRMKVVIACFTNSSSATTVPARYDRQFQDDYRFQVAIERNPVAATTGIPAGRPLFTFEGSNIAEYFVADNVWYLVSDWMEFETTLEELEPFRFWTTVESRALAAGKIPVWGPKAASNFMQRYMGEVRSLSASLIDSGAAANATALTNLPASTNSGTNSGLTFGPCMALVETDAGIEFVSDFGSSFTAGFGEGFGTASTTNIAPFNTFGDAYGSPFWSAFGWIDRAVLEETIHQMSVRASKPSQRGWEVVAGAAAGRLELLRLANPSVVIPGMLTNDLGETTTVTARATNTAYAKYADVLSGGRSYICLHGGTSSTTLATLPDRPIVYDGSCVWWRIGTFTGTGQQGPRVIATIMQVNDLLKQYVPNAKLLGQLPPPRTTSTDNWASAANQTPVLNWEANGKESVVYNFMKANFKAMGFDGLIDPNLAGEDAATPNTTNIWVTESGVAQATTYDGTHVTSFMAANLGPAVVLGLREISGK